MSDYNGIYIRDTLNDTGTIPSADTRPTYSPDVICYQKYTLTWSMAKDKYEKNINMSFIQNNINNIYIRARNIGNKTLSSKVRAYYANVNIMFEPSRWIPLKTFRGETDVDLAWNMGDTNIPSGEVALSKEAYRLSKIKEAQLHTCMFGMCQDENGQWPPLPEHFKDNAEMWEFLRYHPNIAYNNIQIVFSKDGVVNLPVEFGNHDAVKRKFMLNVTVTEGLDYLSGSELIIQCTDMACTFCNSQVLEKDRDSYFYKYEVPEHFYSSMDIVFQLHSPANVNSTVHIENYLVVEEDEKVILPTSVFRHTISDFAEKATKVGDFLLVITNGESSDRKDGAENEDAASEEMCSCFDISDRSPEYKIENGLRCFAIED